MKTACTHNECQSRFGTPRAVRLSLCANHPYLTFSGECQCATKTEYFRFAVIGTSYGFLHTSGGDIRILKSARTAYKVAQKYRDLTHET